MKLYKLAMLGVVSSLTLSAYALKFKNHTPDDIWLEADIALYPDAREAVPKGESKDIKNGMLHPIRHMILKAKIGSQPMQPVIEQDSYDVGDHEYDLFCEPVIKTKQIPGGYAQVIAAYKYFLVRKAPWYVRLFYTNGVVAESKEFNIAEDRTDHWFGKNR